MPFCFAFHCSHASQPPAFIRASKGLPWVDLFTALTPSCQPREQDQSWEEENEDETLTALLHCPISELFNERIPSEQLQLAARKKVKSRYTCTHCKTNVWGKSKLKILCGECGAVYEEHEAA